MKDLQPIENKDAVATKKPEVLAFVDSAEQLPQWVHRFTPGLYVREIFMPKGVYVIGKQHKTEHPYVVSKGRAAVWTEEQGVVEIKAPFCGITKPGTRRILYILEDCVWTTFHPTTETDLEKIEAAIIENVPPVIEADRDICKQLAAAVEKGT